MKKILLLLSMFLILSKVSASDELFPLSGLVPFSGEDKVTITYEPGDEYAQVTYAPDFPWNHHSGWNLESEPVDLTGYTHLVFDFESVDVVIGQYGTNVDITITSAVGNKEMKGSASVTAGRVAVNLTGFTAEEIASVKRLSIGVWDPEESKAIFNVKKVSLANEESDYALLAFKSLYWGASLTKINYEVGSGYVDVTLLPADPWGTQVGWEFGSENPIDLSGNTHFIVEFEAVDIVEGAEMEVYVTTTEEGTEATGRAAATDSRVVVDLSGLYAYQLEKVKMVSVWVWDNNSTDTAIFKVKEAYPIIDDLQFPLSKINALSEEKAATTKYVKPTDENAAYIEVTMQPSAPAASQVGWSYPEDGYKDFTGFSYFQVDFEAVNIASGDVRLVVTSLHETEKQVTATAAATATELKVDLSEFTAEELAAIKSISISVDDAEAETAVLKIKKASLKKAETSIKNIEEDDNALVDVYSITGVKVRTQVNRSEVIKELPNGLYIIGNKKVYINN